MVGNRKTGGLHSQIRKRALFEITGLAVLSVLVYHQRQFVRQAVDAIRDNDPLFFCLAVVAYWFFLPITALSFKLLSEKKIPLLTATAAHLAGSGPGRIIPASLGRAGLMVIYLRKIGFNLQSAVVITTANSLIGVAINTLLLLVVLLYQPAVRGGIANAAWPATIAGVSIAVFLLVAIIVSILNLKSLRKTKLKLNTAWRQVRTLLVRHPSRMVGLILSGLIIILSNLLILLLCALALDQYFVVYDLFIALSAGVVIGSLLPTPGGIGGVEAGIIAVLILLGYEPAASTGTALLYRAVTYWMPLLPGTAAYFYLREKKLV